MSLSEKRMSPPTSRKDATSNKAVSPISIMLSPKS